MKALLKKLGNSPAIKLANKLAEKEFVTTRAVMAQAKTSTTISSAISRERPRKASSHANK